MGIDLAIFEISKNLSLKVGQATFLGGWQYTTSDIYSLPFIMEWASVSRVHV